MKLGQEDLGLLERKYAMYVLLAVDKYPGSTKTTIMRLEPGFEKTKFIRLTELTAAGLIDYDRENEDANISLRLTPAGAEVVATIKVLRRKLLTVTKAEDSSEPSAEQ